MCVSRHIGTFLKIDQKLKFIFSCNSLVNTIYYLKLKWLAVYFSSQNYSIPIFSNRTVFVWSLFIVLSGRSWCKVLGFRAKNPMNPIDQ